MDHREVKSEQVHLRISVEMYEWLRKKAYLERKNINRVVKEIVQSKFEEDPKLDGGAV